MGAKVTKDELWLYGNNLAKIYQARGETSKDALKRRTLSPAARKKAKRAVRIKMRLDASRKLKEKRKQKKKKQSHIGAVAEKVTTKSTKRIDKMLERR